MPCCRPTYGSQERIRKAGSEAGEHDHGSVQQFHCQLTHLLLFLGWLAAPKRRAERANREGATDGGGRLLLLYVASIPLPRC